ncbi:MAG TPA: hypothetical protein VFU82_00650 [Gammaproteobacteria bacterium]|nr:hypothetical protein [Gammaproteobacteria bacterium]
MSSSRKNRVTNPLISLHDNLIKLFHSEFLSAELADRYCETLPAILDLLLKRNNHTNDKQINTLRSQFSDAGEKTQNEWIQAYQEMLINSGSLNTDEVEKLKELILDAQPQEEITKNLPIDGLELQPMQAADTTDEQTHLASLIWKVVVHNIDNPWPPILDNMERHRTLHATTRSVINLSALVYRVFKNTMAKAPIEIKRESFKTIDPRNEHLLNRHNLYRLEYYETDYLRTKLIEALANHRFNPFVDIEYYLKNLDSDKNKDEIKTNLGDLQTLMATLSEAADGAIISTLKTFSQRDDLVKDLKYFINHFLLVWPEEQLRNFFNRYQAEAEKKKNPFWGFYCEHVYSAFLNYKEKGSRKMKAYQDVLTTIQNNLNNTEQLKKALEALLIEKGYLANKNALFFQRKETHSGKFADHLKTLYSLEGEALIEQYKAFMKMLHEEKHPTHPKVRHALLDHHPDYQNEKEREGEKCKNIFWQCYETYLPIANQSPHIYSERGKGQHKLPIYADVLKVILENASAPDQLKESLKDLLIRLKYLPKENAGYFESGKLHSGRFAKHLNELYKLESDELIKQCRQFMELLSEEKHSNAPAIRNVLLGVVAPLRSIQNNIT